jgi:hypothetical protein
MQLLSVMICYPVFVTYSESALDMVVLSFWSIVYRDMIVMATSSIKWTWKIPQQT